MLTSVCREGRECDPCSQHFDDHEEVSTEETKSQIRSESLA